MPTECRAAAGDAGSKTRAPLARNPRVHLDSTTTSAPWLNLVERCVGQLTQRQIRRLAVTSVDRLIAMVIAYIDQCCVNLQPLAWTATVNQRLDKVGNANTALTTLR